MSLSRTARLSISCAVFLFALFLSSSVDLSVILALSIYLLLANINYQPVFLISILLFLLSLLLDYFDINIRFVSDLAVDAYILFVIGVVIYLRSRKDLIHLIKKIDRKEGKLLSPKSISYVLPSTVLFLLLFPITGGYLAATVGYFFFSYLLRQFNGKIAIVAGLVILVSAAFFLIFGKSAIAEELGNYTYLFLVIGTLQEIFNLARQKQPELGKELLAGKFLRKKLKVKEEKEKEETRGIPAYEGFVSIKPVYMKLPRFHLPEINKSLLAAGLAFLLAFGLVFWSKPQIPKISFSLPNIKDKLSQLAFLKKPVSPTPLPSPSPTPSPTMAPVASPTPAEEKKEEFFKLKIFVQNGTEINKLAASTSAKLKEAGFENINIGNASTQDYTSWEIALKEKNDHLVSLIKQVLILTDLKSSEATIPAGFDVLIVAGKEK